MGVAQQVCEVRAGVVVGAEYWRMHCVTFDHQVGNSYRQATGLLQGCRHDFGIGGAELELGRKLCARLANFLLHPPVCYHAHLLRITAI